MLYQQDPFDVHTSAVDAVAAAGITPPADWLALRQRFDDFCYLKSPTMQQLAAAVIDGGAESDIAGLRAQALAEATALPPAEAQVTAGVKTAVLNAMRDLYSPVAQRNYKKLAAEFTSTAQKFTEAAGVIDPETEASLLVGASESERLAWIAAQEHAYQLTAQVAGLQAAASLAGTPTAQKEQLLALTVEANGLHRRRVWEAFEETGGRTGRWGALRALGARIRAADLDSYEPYRKPKPMEVKQMRHGIGVRQILVDPEDAPEPEPAMT